MELEHYYNAGALPFMMNKEHSKSKSGKGHVGGFDPLSPYLLSIYGAASVKLGSMFLPILKDEASAWLRNRRKDFQEHKYNKYFVLTKYIKTHGFMYHKGMFSAKTKFKEFLEDAQKHMAEDIGKGVRDTIIPDSILTKYFETLSKLKEEDLYRQLVVAMRENVNSDILEAKEKVRIIASQKKRLGVRVAKSKKRNQISHSPPSSSSPTGSRPLDAVIEQNESSPLVFVGPHNKALRPSKDQKPEPLNLRKTRRDSPSPQSSPIGSPTASPSDVLLPFSGRGLGYSKIVV